MPWTLCFLIVICSLTVRVTSDPCVTYSFLPNDGLRYVFNKIDGTYEAFNDRYLVPGWYRSCLRMPETAPDSIFRCGTKFPIWLNGDHPTTSTQVTRTACVRSLFGTCPTSYSIEIVMCGDGCYRYNLDQTSDSSSYCFGIGTDGDTPLYEPGKPTLNVEEDRIEIFSLPITSAVFVCDFEESVDEDLLYMVHWYRNGIHHYNTPLAKNSANRTLHITEDVFVAEKFTMGIELSCSVTAFNVADGPASKRSPQSESQFVGIKTLTPSVTFKSSSSGTIQLQPTVPIGCQGVETCKLRLVSYLPDPEVSGVCIPVAFTGECGALIYNNNIGGIINLTVTANDNGQVDVGEDRNQIFLRVIETHENKIWGGYELPPVSVTITPGTVSIPNTNCRILNDPHIFTFDNRIFDHHEGGSKTAYKNVKEQTEVQILSRRCSSFQSSDVPHCICGVAVRAGHDVYVKNICDDVTMGYRYCSGSGRTLTVKAINDRDIKIHFTYGTYVHVRQSGSFLTVYIYPSTSDYRNTRGLCGTFDENRENDFHYQNGSSMSTEYHNMHPNGYFNPPTTFIAEWTVLPESDLFSDQFNTGNLQDYLTQICVCEDPAGGVGGTGAIENEIPCTKNGATKCSHGTLLEANHCTFISTNRRRRSIGARRRVPTVEIHNYFVSNSRAVRQASETVWTETAAMNYCQDKFNLNPVYTHCSQIPSVKPEDSVDVCTADTQITNGTEWVDPSIWSMASECTEELLRNVTIVKAAESGETLYGIIKNESCPNDCFERGQCTGGKCICDAGAGGSDCSVDLGEKVTMSGALDGGLCDKTESGCNSTFVFGGAFVDSDTLRCRVVEFQEDDLGARIYGDTHIVTPAYITFVELGVSFAALRRKRSTVSTESSFISGYSISVTNDGLTYSDSTDLFVYDSECQLVQEIDNTWHFTLKDGFCFIDNQCIVDGVANAADACFFCNALSAPTAWSLNASKAGCAENEVPRGDDDTNDDDTNDIPIIVGSSVGGFVVVTVLVAAAVLVIKNMSRPKSVVGNSTLFDTPAIIRANSASGWDNALPKFQKQKLGL